MPRINKLLPTHSINTTKTDTMLKDVVSEFIHVEKQTQNNCCTLKSPYKAKPFHEKLVKCFDSKSRNLNKFYVSEGQKIDSANYLNKFYAHITAIWKNISKENKNLR